MTTPQDLRTLALLGHAGAGKTTLIESVLVSAGAIPQAGSVDRGTTVCDYDPLEKEHGHSAKLAVANFERAGTLVHLLDTPGFPDFAGQALAALDAADTVATVVNAQNGIEITARRAMLWAQTRKLCRLVVVNKIDAERVNLPALVEELQAAFGRECLPINLPADGGSRVVDCFFNLSGDATDFSSIEDAHRALVEQVVEVDEALTERYLEGEEIAPEALHDAFERALREDHLVPVLFVSARTGAGIPELIDFIVRLAPSPLEGNPPLFEKWPGGNADAAEPLIASHDPNDHALAHVFKVEVDPYMGKIGVVRVLQGTLTPDTQLYAGEARKPFRVAHLFRMQGKQLTPIDRAGPGEICAITKIDDMAFDAVLHDAPEDAVIHFHPLPIPHAVYGLAVRVKRRGDEQKLAEILHRLAAEDPGLHVEHDVTTHEAVIRGQGELHLSRILEKMRAQYKLEVDSHPPTIPYRETITLAAEGHHRHKKQSGGAGQFGEVYLKIAPLARGEGFRFVDAVKGGTIPGVFIPAVEKGVRDVLGGGAIAGFPVQDLEVTVYDGKTHPVDGKEVAFITAGRKAFLDAISKARGMVLEPIVNLEVTVPEMAIGDVNGELALRRGQVTQTGTARGGMVTINARAPLAELNDFQGRLKSITGGQGSYTLEMADYEPAPPNVQQALTAAFKPVDEE
ncbi:elongation factor G [Niveibacterium microcysteis]|uniref:Elongation factor G n=1 Tax=Niveibacterium microcysteis TaxID=2811415 RepID=A0ABX7M0D7_9RHOO|nr:elongation factor G [Niveibacterium microcysteis]QSI75232.1 elongation factor G [Niveibacterium microcysteis]